ncbi:LIVCS family branched-chain amino acid:cation transporter [Desmospora profundinema]|uniref:Branched-chain amino acid transport system carrier protein n=1 Tax=Desmospora profundinema TaxID=1571184 RepID=A0ABU1INN7_9BACL|nr:branched-chain amino acid transport system II carrier protein [Desmospora profundinema]MDR6226382.1 LIVCS family branched-chain amino acid:cation transporter [Desmospora profundinema]
MLSKRESFVIGLMLFALFFGAGNMIFPPALGQAAGSNLWPALIGFIITGVGLPLLGVIAVGVSGGNLQAMAGKVHPVFGVIFPTIVYLAIGPMFGIPRTGTVAFEMGASPFLSEGLREGVWPLFLYTVIFFGLTFWLALNPSKLVGRIGKILTPVLLALIVMLLIKSWLDPIGGLAKPVEAYESTPFVNGFLEGYLTMDTLGALVFGIVVINAIRDRGVTGSRDVARNAIRAAVVAGVGLAFFYLVLGYLGGTSAVLGESDNGAQILARVSHELFGPVGVLLLGSAVTIACLTTSVGLVTAASLFFSRLLRVLSYNQVALALCLVSLGVANLGLTQIITISVPVLVAVYPIAIVLIILTLLDQVLSVRTPVFVGALVGTALISLFDGLAAFHVPLGVWGQWLALIPLQPEGIGWLFPALIGGIIGAMWNLFTGGDAAVKKRTVTNGKNS